MNRYITAIDKVEISKDLKFKILDKNNNGFNKNLTTKKLKLICVISAVMLLVIGFSTVANPNTNIFFETTKQEGFRSMNFDQIYNLENMSQTHNGITVTIESIGFSDDSFGKSNYLAAPNTTAFLVKVTGFQVSRSHTSQPEIDLYSTKLTDDFGTEYRLGDVNTGYFDNKNDFYKTVIYFSGRPQKDTALVLKIETIKTLNDLKGNKINYIDRNGPWVFKITFNQ